jgi:hypothetical protein
VARLALLYSHGGLYVDCHAGKPDVGALLKVFAALATHELVAFMIRPPAGSPIPEHLVNGALCARAGSLLIDACLGDVIANLRKQDALEENSDERASYNIAALTGAWVLRVRWFKMDRQELMLRDSLADRIALCRVFKEPFPFLFYRHYGYRLKGQHWSERQSVEPLFERAVA